MAFCVAQSGSDNNNNAQQAPTMARTKQKPTKAGALARGEMSRAGKTPRIHRAGKALAGMKKPTPKKFRFKPGTVALRDIRKYQKSFDLVIAKAPFGRLVRQIMAEHAPNSWGGGRLTQSALEALQEGAESFLVDHLSTSMRWAVHAGRVTLQAKDSRETCATAKSQNLPIYKEMSVKDGRLSTQQQIDFKRKEHERLEKLKEARKKQREAKLAAKESKEAAKERKRAEIEAAAAEEAALEDIDVEED